MGSGQSKPIDNNRTFLPKNDSVLCKPNKYYVGKPTYKYRPVPVRERTGLRTSSQSDASPSYVDDPPLRMGTTFRRTAVGNNRRGYNSLKEPINRKYPWRGGNENEKNISLLPKQHSLKPWGPIKGYYASDAGYSSNNESFEKQALKARDAQSRFCHEIHERYAAMGETEKRRRLEAIHSLENRLQNKSVFSGHNVNKFGSKRTHDLKSQTSSNGSIMGVPKTNEPVRNPEIHAWRVEHLSNYERERASSISKTGKMKVISDRYNEIVRNNDNDVKDKLVDLFNVGYRKPEVPASEINSRRSSKKRSNAMYVNKMYNYSRLNTLMASSGNYSKLKGRTGKGILYPRQTNKAVFLLLKTFANSSPSPVPTRHTKSGEEAAALCDKSTSISSENFKLSYNSVETQTTPVHISRKINLDSFVLSQLDKVPKLEVDHRGGLIRHVSSTPSTRTLCSTTQQVVLGYSHGVTIDTRKRNDNHERRDNLRQRSTISEKDATDDWSSNDKFVARRIVADNIAQRNALRDKEAMDDRLNNEKFVTRRIDPENSRQRVNYHDKEYNSDKFLTRTVPNNTVRERPQNGPFTHDTPYYHATNYNHTECKSRAAYYGRHCEKKRNDESDRVSERTYGPPNPAKSYQNTHHKTDTAKEEYYRVYQKRCRIPVPTQHRYDHNNDPASLEKRIVKREPDTATNKDKMKMNSEDYKSLCKLRLDMVNGCGDRYVPKARYEGRNSSIPDEDSEDVDRLLCGQRKSCRHWGKSSATRCNVCQERICYNIKEDEEDSENFQRIP